jgi:hypothetical protein
LLDCGGKVVVAAQYFASTDAESDQQCRVEFRTFGGHGESSTERSGIGEHGIRCTAAAVTAGGVVAQICGAGCRPACRYGAGVAQIAWIIAEWPWAIAIDAQFERARLIGKPVDRDEDCISSRKVQSQA